MACHAFSSDAGGDRQGLVLALISWEWAQRGEHVFGALRSAITGRRSEQRPLRRLPEGRRRGVDSLVDEDVTPLYPELMTRLDAIRKARIGGPMTVRDWKNRRAGLLSPYTARGGGLTNVHHEVKASIRAASMRDDLSLTSSGTAPSRSPVRPM